MRSVPLVMILALVQSSSSLSTAFSGIEAGSGGRLGVFAQLIESEDSSGLNETERFPMQSVYKLPIAMAVLDQVDRKALTLNQKVSLSAGDMVPDGRHLAIAVFVKDSTAGLVPREAAIARAAKAAWDHWTARK